ncbi:MAG: hypothetical protein KAT56_02260, partial [Sedimentisphaerales bacterium]|nr:hypothetical protein [Sedimentisphaerales bacterium]
PPIGSPYYSPVDRGNQNQWDSTQTNSVPYLVIWNSDYYAIGRIVGENEGTETILDGDDWDNPSVPDAVWLWGAQADADGDGVADSRWVKVPNLTGPRGQNVYTAVRIVDNGGMINVNTATWFNSANSDGSRLTDVNLLGLCRSGDIPGYMYGYRCSSDLPPAPPPSTLPPISQYNSEVAIRVLNPVNPSTVTGLPYFLYDLTDELEFRNRFFLDSPVVNRTEFLWPTTFTGGGGLTKELPYNDPTDLPKWFQKAYFDISVPDLYTRRHICTTYSFDRVIMPWQNVANNGLNMPGSIRNGNRWYGWTNWNNNDKSLWRYRPICINDYNSTNPAKPTLKQIAAAIWLGLPDGATIKKMPQFDNVSWSDDEFRERLACQMAVNMVDCADNNKTAAYLKTGSGNSANHYYGFEYYGENPYISMIAITRYDSDVSPAHPVINEETHYAIEIYNPGPSKVDLSNWEIEVKNSSGGTVNTHRLSLIAQQSDRIIDPCDSVVLIDYNPASPPVAAFSTLSNPVPVYIGSAFTLENDYKLELKGIKNNRTPDFINSIGMLPNHLQLVAGVEEFSVNRMQSAGKVHVLRGNGNCKFPVWESPNPLDWPGAPATNLDQNKFGVIAKDARLPMQLKTADRNFKTAGEVFNVLSLGAMNIEGDYYTIPEFLERIRNNYDPCDITIGKTDAADPCFVDLPRFLTVFHPFSDSVDNDGNGLSDDPCNDGADNDRDGFADADDPEQNETFANFSEFSELEVAGRININTAPWFVIAQLPWVVDPTLPLKVGGKDNEDRHKLARAIVAYRDKTIDSSGTINYSVQSANPQWNGALWVGADTDNAKKPRKFGMGLQNGDPDVREEVGFANIAELLNVTHNLNNGPGDIATYDEYYDIRRYGRDEDTGTPKNNNPV